MISGIILNQLKPKLAAKLVANEKRCLKAVQRSALTGQATVFDLKIFF